MPRCAAIKPNGERCKVSATGPHGYCWAHDPAHAEKRRRMASRAARAKPNGELADLKKQLEELAGRLEALEEVLKGRRSR